MFIHVLNGIEIEFTERQIFDKTTRLMLPCPCRKCHLKGNGNGHQAISQHDDDVQGENGDPHQNVDVNGEDPEQPEQIALDLVKSEQV